MIEFIKNFFIDGTTGIPSSKRLVGIIASLAIIGYMFIYPSAPANNSVLFLALGGLGLTTIDKVFKPK